MTINNNSRNNAERDMVTAVLEAAPFGVEIWDGSGNLVACNDQLLGLLGAVSFNNFSENYFEKFCPKLQNCGKASVDKAKELIEKTRLLSRIEYEWTYLNAQGTPMPVSSTFTSFLNGDERMFASYVTNHRSIFVDDTLKTSIDSNERLQIILEAAPMAIAVFDLENRHLLDCNREMLQTFGYVHKEKFLHTFTSELQTFFPKYQPCGTLSTDIVDEIFEIAKKQKHHRMEILHLAKGKELYTDVSFVVTTHLGKEIMMLYMRDLTFEIEAELARQEHETSVFMEQKLKVMLDSMPVICVIFDEAHNPLEVNQAAAEMFGFEDKEEYLTRFTEICPRVQPDGMPTRKKVKLMLEQTFEYGLANFEWMHCMPGKEENLIPCEVQMQKVTLGDQQVVVCYVRDVREQHILLEFQATEQERLQATLDVLPLVCLLIDSSHRGFSVNKKAEELFGIADMYDFLNNMTDYMPEFQPDGTDSAIGSKQMLDEAFENGYSKYEWTFKKESGELFICEVVTEIIHFGANRLAIVYIRDLSEEKAMIQKLEESISREQIANEAKTRFLARMSHEIRTPMNSVMGITELQLQKDTLTADTEEAFKRIYSSSGLLLAIINDILDLSKVEAGKMEIVPAIFEVASMIIDTVQLNMIYIDDKPIEFTLNVDETLPQYMVGDELRLKQILNNILSNAFKYTLAGEVSLSFEREKTNDPELINMVVVISDTGQGMSEQQLDSLYVDFTRFNNEANKGVEGTGLGLSIAHQLIHMMGGTISAKSKLGKGSTFTLQLPLKPHTDELIGTKTAGSMQNLEHAQRSLEKISKMEREPMPYGRVLVVDDVESNLFVAKGFLIPYKLAVETVESGILAIEKIKDGEVYDIIFMDYMMPEMDGIETTKILRDLGYTQPIVALTANAFNDMAVLFRENGFDGYMSKPIDINQMDKYLLEFVRDKQPADVIERARSAKQINAPEEEEGLSEILVLSFLRDARKAYGIIESDYETDDLSSYTIQTHAMRSALHNIGHPELAIVAGKLEAASRRKDFEEITITTPSFLRMLKEVIKKLDKQEESAEEFVPTDADIAFLHKQLRTLHDACEDFEIDLARGALNALSQKMHTKDTKAVIDEIYDTLLSGDLDEVARLSEQLIKDTTI